MNKTTNPFTYTNKAWDEFSLMKYDNIQMQCDNEMYFQTFFPETFNDIPDEVDSIYIQCFECPITENIPIIITSSSIFIQHPILNNIPPTLKYIHIKHSVFPYEWFRLPYGCEIKMEACLANCCNTSFNKCYTDRTGFEVGYDTVIEGYLQDFNMRR